MRGGTTIASGHSRRACRPPIAVVHAARLRLVARGEHHPAADDRPAGRAAAGRRAARPTRRTRRGRRGGSSASRRTRTHVRIVAGRRRAASAPRRRQRARPDVRVEPRRERLARPPRPCCVLERRDAPDRPRREPRPKIISLWRSRTTRGWSRGNPRGAVLSTSPQTLEPTRLRDRHETGELPARDVRSREKRRSRCWRISRTSPPNSGRSSTSSASSGPRTDASYAARVAPKYARVLSRASPSNHASASGPKPSKERSMAGHRTGPTRHDAASGNRDTPAAEARSICAGPFTVQASWRWT